MAEKKSMEIQKRECSETDSVERTRSRKSFVPAVDIYETTDSIIMTADMPGVSKKSVDITLEKNILTIQGIVDDSSPKGYDLKYMEYEIGDFQRSFTISDEIDREKIRANVDNGVLTLTLPKSEKVKTKRIPIS